MRFCLMASLVALLAGCSGKPQAEADLGTRDVTLPGGRVIRCEQMIDRKDMLRGMMFRQSLAADRGMLFVYRTPGQYSYWTYQHLIPLDIVWIDGDRKIVEIVANVPPCKTAASKCLVYGGRQEALYVLELGAGLAEKYGLHVGSMLEF